MSKDEFFGERDDHRLLVLLGRYLAAKYPTLLEEDERFMNWLARDLRRRPPEDDDWSSERVQRVRRRVVERALAERLAVHDGGRAPATQQVPSTTVAQALDDGARERCAPWIALSAAAGEGRELWDEDCDRWVELPAGVDAGRYVALGVAGDSMLPLLHAGDTILVRLGTEVRRDTVIVARRGEDGYVVKRVGQVRGRYLELLSTNPAYAPVLIRRDECSVLGTVLMRWCAHDPAVVSVKQ